jgi:secreted Zn-dependent insulinase-like peptidase
MLKDNLIAVMQEKDKNLNKMIERYWETIKDKTLDFEKKGEIIEILKDISQEEVIEFY